MNEIESRILLLKEELSMLESVLARGYDVFEDHHSTYTMSNTHSVLTDADGNVLALIVDEEIVRKYIQEKDKQNAQD